MRTKIFSYLFVDKKLSYIKSLPDFTRLCITGKAIRQRSGQIFKTYRHQMDVGQGYRITRKLSADSWGYTEVT